MALAATVVAAAAGCGGDGGGGVAAAQEGAEPGERPAITATGVGRATGVPDTLVVTLNVRTDGDSAAETMDEASLRTRQLLDAARGQGVADEDLQTTHVSLFPRFDDDGNRIVGYSADQTFTVRYRDLDTAGAKLDELLGVGGDHVRVHGVSLLLDDDTEVLEEARADAVERARAQAEQLAEAAGVDLGGVRSIREVTGQQPFPFAGESFGAGRSAAALDAAVDVPLAPGSQELTVQVEVVYEIR